MTDEHSQFADYLSRHCVHLGDQEKHRAGKKRQLRRTYARHFPEDRAAEMLEIGPGWGHLLELLRWDLGYSNLRAVDVSQEVVQFCNRCVPDSTIHVADTAGYLRQHPARFDRVFAFHVLEHVPKTEVVDLVRAIRTALRPGGKLVVEVPNMANLMTAGYLRYADLTHESGYSETSLRFLLESADLAEVECFEDRPSPDGLKSPLASIFRAGARVVQRVIYKGYELPVPAVLSPALCATAVRPPD